MYRRRKKIENKIRRIEATTDKVKIKIKEFSYIHELNIVIKKTNLRKKKQKKNHTYKIT
jgi:hypothetical protein